MAQAIGITGYCSNSPTWTHVSTMSGRVVCCFCWGGARTAPDVCQRHPVRDSSVRHICLNRRRDKSRLYEVRPKSMCVAPDYFCCRVVQNSPWVYPMFHVKHSAYGTHDASHQRVGVVFVETRFFASRYTCNIRRPWASRDIAAIVRHGRMYQRCPGGWCVVFVGAVREPPLMFANDIPYRIRQYDIFV